MTDPNENIDNEEVFHNPSHGLPSLFDEDEIDNNGNNGNEVPEGVFPFGVDAEGNPNPNPNGEDDNGNQGNDGDTSKDDDNDDDDENLTDEEKTAKEAAAAAGTQNNSDDLTEEEIRKLTEEEEDGSKAPVPVETLETLAKEIGIESSPEKPVTLDAIVEEVKKLKSFDAEADEDIKTLKTFKALNPQATMAEYVKEFAPQFDYIKAKPDEFVYFKYLTSVEKKSDEDARYEVSKMSETELAEKTKPIRDELASLDAQRINQAKQKLDDLKQQANQKVIGQRKALVEAINKNKDILGGMFKMSKTDIVSTVEGAKKGELESAIKDPLVYAELLFLHKNKAKVLQALKGNAFEEGKGLILETFANQTPNQPRRNVNTKSTPGKITASGW